jgi:hypothetical protein
MCLLAHNRPSKHRVVADSCKPLRLPFEFLRY